MKRDPDLGKIKGLLVQHTASIAPGSSGGPLVDDAGRVIGANHSHYQGTEINLAAHVDVLRELIVKTDLGSTPSSIGSDVRQNLLTSAALFIAIALAWMLTAYVERRRRNK